nr:MMPL family transporter [Vibrio gangliei]
MLVLVALLITQVSKSLPIETNIMALLPKNQQDPIAQAAFDKVASSMSDKVIFLVGSPSFSTSKKAAEKLEQDLKGLPLFKQVDGKVDDNAQQAWGKFFFDARFQLLTHEQQQRLHQNPAAQTQYVIQSLYHPFSGVSATELSQDPFLLFRDYLKQLTANSGQFKLSHGYLTREYQGKHYILLTADLNGSAYSLNLQQQLPQLENIEQGIRTQWQDDEISLLHTGVIFYAAHGSESAKSEISTIGAGSLVGIILLVLFIYRSMMPLNLALLSIACGFVAAFVVTVALFGKVHLFSLVFGASLIGVSIDYAFHYLTERLAAGSKWHAQQGLKHILIAISLGLITSLIGYLGMMVAPFPGLQQLALFSSVGLIAAYATVVCWYPILAATPSAPRPLPAHAFFARWLQLWQHKHVRIALPGLLLIAAVLGLFHVQYNDDIRQLQALPASLQQQEQQIKAITGINNSQQMLLVSAESRAALLQRLQQVSQLLDQQIQQGQLSSYQSLSQFIPSPEQQQQNFSLIQTLYQSQVPVLQQTLQLKQTPQLSAEFKAIDIEDFLASAVSKPLRFLWLGQLEGQYSAMISLNGVKDSSAIKQVANQNPDVRYLNKTEEVSELFGLYRQHVTELLALASAFILLVVSLRYGLAQGIRIVLPPLIAGCVGLAITTLTGASLNLFNLLALILILGIGIDYTLFFAEQSRAGTHSGKKVTATLLAITLSALTTLLSFGLLALSQTQAIQSFGITVLFGILVSWLLAPLAMSYQNTSYPKAASNQDTGSSNTSPSAAHEEKSSC